MPVNHEKIIEPKTRLPLWLIIFVLAVGFGAVWSMYGLALATASLVFVSLLIFQSYNLSLGWYVLVLLSPFYHWQIELKQFESYLQGVPILLGVHAPAIEFWAIFLFIAYALNYARQWLASNKPKLVFPGGIWFGLFIVTALISLYNLAPWDRGAGIKYIIHFLLLFYFGFLFLGANIITKEIIWLRSLKVFFFTGIFGAIMGFVSLILGVWANGAFRRAVPISLWGWAPLGDQHIFLAEVLAVAFPIGIYLWHISKKEIKQFYGVMTIFILLIGLLTLSRALWVTLIILGISWYYIQADRDKLLAWLKRYYLLVIVLTISAVYMGLFWAGNDVVRSSNLARWEFTRMSLFLWERHPIIGIGIGAFPDQILEMYAYRLEFGVNSVDAHGIIQKILAEQGLLGFIAFALFIFSLMRSINLRAIFSRFHRVNADQALAGFVLLTPLIFQLFNTQFYTSKMWVPIALALGYRAVKRP